jgi:hypothetical protein
MDLYFLLRNEICHPTFFKILSFVFTTSASIIFYISTLSQLPSGGPTRQPHPFTSPSPPVHPVPLCLPTPRVPCLSGLCREVGLGADRRARPFSRGDNLQASGEPRRGRGEAYRPLGRVEPGVGRSFGSQGVGERSAAANRETQMAVARRGGETAAAQILRVPTATTRRQVPFPPRVLCGCSWGTTDWRNWRRGGRELAVTPQVFN